MEPEVKLPSSPGSPLNTTSPDRVNKQRAAVDMNGSPTRPRVGTMFSPERAARESSVFEKAAKFDMLAAQGKPHERKVNDAAIKRAVLGREEAEEQARRYRDERNAVQEKYKEEKQNCTKVSRRLEAAIESNMKLKETYAHTKTQWETEIRRLRKENNKLTSETIKYREELKEHRAELRKAKATISEEKERTDEREKEAFTARYQLEGLQQQLTEAMEKIKLVEQERDSFKTLAKSEEVARIAAEGQIPMPSSPKKEVARPELEVPMPIMSMADEQDVEHLKLSLDWERARANRAYDLVDFMKLECRFNSCACCLRAPSTSNKAKNATNVASNSTTRVKNPEDALEFEHPGRESVLQSTVFIASEGIFRTVASPSKEGRQEQADERQSRTRSPEHRKNMSQTRFPVVPSPSSMGPPRHSRTPSCDPPNYRNSVVSNDASGMFADEPAVNLGNGRAVMDRKENIVFQPPLVPKPQVRSERLEHEFVKPASKPLHNLTQSQSMSFDVPVSSTRHEEFVKPALTSFGISNSQSMNFDDTIRPGSRLATSQSMQFPPVDSRPAPPSRIASNYSDETSKLSISADRSSYIRPISRSSVPRSPVHAHAPAYHTISTTTRIPLKPDTPDSEPTSNTSSFSHRYSNSTSATTPNRPLSAMSGGSEGGALSVSREEALAMIKERRSRSRSMKEGMATPRKPSRGPTPAVSTGRSARSTSRGRPNTGRV